MTLEPFLNKFKRTVACARRPGKRMRAPAERPGPACVVAGAHMLSARAWPSCDITQWKVFASTAGIIVEW